MVRVTNPSRISALLRRQPGLDDDQISERLGITPRQQVNQICRRLESRGELERVPGHGGKIVNYLAGTRPADSPGATGSRKPATAGIPSRRKPGLEARQSPAASGPKRETVAVIRTKQLRTTLIILPCSRGKRSDLAGRKTGPCIADHLSPGLAKRLLRARKAANIDERTMVPAWQRYDGHLHKAARNALSRAVEENLHVLIISGGYGVLLADEPIGLYDAAFNPKQWPSGLLEEVIASYARRHELRSVRAFASASTKYRGLVQRVDWCRAGVDDAVLLMPEPVRGGAMVKGPRAQGEALVALFDGASLGDWRSCSDELSLVAERLR